MKRLVLFYLSALLSLCCFANTIVVKNIGELKKANSDAQPGDIIILQNGVWNDVTIELDCNGSKEKPVTFKAQSNGRVIISGNSMLKIGGNYIVVEGLLFKNGHAGDHAVIDFRIGKNQLGNNCRVTDCVVDDFNNPKRLQENYWVSFSGKNNRLDHCSFVNKKNLGVLVAVILDDDRSRENFHSIDHNYFGLRLPLASNGGEIIRVGVSQHCQFNSNTQITDNFFEHCDGETEIVSIKSCGNVVRNNLFKECQGGVVLRHGNYNTVENNIFLGNNKEGTGGVRVINKGQWVINNFFYKCRGVDFRSPLSVMNGIPNSPANRYVQVTDAVIANNTWLDCTPVSFCEGSDTERTLAPANTMLLNNIFYNTRDNSIYKAFDNTSGFSFAGNEVSKQVKQDAGNGFSPASFAIHKNEVVPIVVSNDPAAVPDSLQQLAGQRLTHLLPAKKGFTDLALARKINWNAYHNCGAGWFSQQTKPGTTNTLTVSCKNADEIYEQLKKREDLAIRLTGSNYVLNKPFIIASAVRFVGNKKLKIAFTTGELPAVFLIVGKGKLKLQDLVIDGAATQAKYFITNDNSGSSEHYNLSVSNTSVQSLDRRNGCQALFFANKSAVADSIVIRNSSFKDNNCDFFMMNDEKDNKGYYNAEKIHLVQNSFTNLDGILLNIYRGGNDESTMGPLLIFRNNKIVNCSSANTPLVSLFGVQRTFIEKNSFSGCNSGAVLIRYDDVVRAAHVLQLNSVQQSGEVITDKYVASAP